MHVYSSPYPLKSLYQTTAYNYMKKGPITANIFSKNLRNKIIFKCLPFFTPLESPTTCLSCLPSRQAFQAHLKGQGPACRQTGLLTGLAVSFLKMEQL
jgi:hypothetical protein